MRYLIIGILLFTSFKATAQNQVINATNKDLEHIVSYVSDKLDLSNVQIFISPLSNNIKEQLKERASFDAKALLIRNNIRSFTIYIDINVQEINEIISHELVHIKQYVDKKLHKIDSTTYTWKGTYYHKNQCPYKMLPWEKQAFSLGQKYVDDYKF